MISTPFCTGTGFIKCVHTTLDVTLVSVGFPLSVVDAAILVIEMEEVLVERMACDGAILANCENMDCFSERFSGTASIIKSALERSEIDVVGSSKERALPASVWVRRDLETSFSRSLSGL